MTTHPNPHAEVWQEAEHRLRLAIRRLSAIDHDLRTGTASLHWSGGAADRFASRTRRRYQEIDQQQASLRYLLRLVQAAGEPT